VNGSPDDHRAEERNKLRLALATFALQFDAFEARLKMQHGQRQTPKSLFGAIEPDPRQGFAGPAQAPDPQEPAQENRAPGIWVEPSLLAEVEYRAKSAEGKLRHPLFKGIREDL
jgi:hypothetical protein